MKLRASRFAKAERGRAFGIYMTATSLAVTVTNSIAPLLSHQFAWSGAYYVLGLATVIAGLVCLAAFALALLAFGFQTTADGFRYMAPVLGLVAFIYSPLMGAIIAEISGPALAASATGLANALWQIGSVIVPLVIGAVFQATGSFAAAFIALAIGPAFGALVMAFVRHD